MTSEELIVAVEERLPVTFVIVNNRRLGMVRQMQEEDFGRRYCATTISSPDFVKLAQAYGIKGVRVSDPAKLDATVARAIRSKAPSLVEVVVEPEANV